MVFQVCLSTQCVEGQSTKTLPGFHYHVPKAIAGNLAASHTEAEPVITPGPELRKALDRRAAQIVTVSCDSTSCVAYDVSYSSITAFNPQQLTATDGNWCFGPGCVPASSLPVASASGIGNSGQNVSDASSTQSAPFGNGADTSATPGPSASSSGFSSSGTISTNVQDTSSTVTQGSTPVGTGNSFSTSSGESAPFGNGTDISSFSAGPTAGTGISSSETSSDSESSGNATNSATPAPSSIIVGTGTGIVSANPTSSTDSSQAPFANGTVASRPQAGPTGTGLSGTGVSPEGTSTTVITSSTILSVTTYSDEQWGPWSAGPANVSITTTCTVEADSTIQVSRVAAAETSFKSTATLGFADTTYTIPIPASYVSDIPSPDAPQAEASSFADAVSADPTSSTAIPALTAYPDTTKPTPLPYYSDTSDHNRSSTTTFDAVSWVTSSCRTSTFYDRVTSGSGFTFIPTNSASICYGIECNAASSCQDWLSVVPFTDSNGNPITTSKSGLYPNGTSAGFYQGTITRSGGFYPAETGTASSQITDNPWSASPNATRNSAAYINTAEITSSVANATVSSAGTDIDAVSTSTLFSTFTDDSGSMVSSAYSTVTLDLVAQTSSSINSTSVQAVQTNNAAALHPWVSWTATLETSTTTAITENHALASSYSGSDTDDESKLHIMHNNLALTSKHKRAAVKARRSIQKREQERQEKKYDALLEKKRVEWEVEGKVEARDEGRRCCQGFDMSCWFMSSKAEGEC